MKEASGVVFRIAEGNRPIPGCTVSKEIYSNADSYIIHFSMAANTDISAEHYEYHKLIMVLEGQVIIYAPRKNQEWHLGVGDCIITPTGVPVGMRCSEDSIYTEISLERTSTMNTAIHSGELFRLADLLPYQEGRVVNMDIMSNSKMKFLIMSFDKGSGLAEHAAPGEALIFALDGEGTIVYEGKEHVLKPGDNFVFAKNGKHAIKAHERFKMALLLTLE